MPIIIIIMFSTDEKSIGFYEKHKDVLKNKKTYIGIKNIDICMINNIKNVTMFDINNTISRLLWKEIALWKREKEEYNIVIWGDDGLAGDIVCAGLQLNIFSKSQKIRYHFITDNRLFKLRHSELMLMNDDELIYYKKSSNKVWEAIANADIVIVADIMDIELLQTIVIKMGEAPLYYYSPDEENLASYISYGKIIPFGRNKDIFTDENIRLKKMTVKASELNRYYADKYNTEKVWDNITGFLKASNISASDYGEVLHELGNKSDENVKAELEHIRWCRFYYLNYYTQGQPDDEKNKDDNRRLHKNLIPYTELTDFEKNKNIETIKIIQDLYK